MALIKGEPAVNDINHVDVLAPPVVDNHVTQLLERVTDARAGKIHGVAVIWSCGPQNVMRHQGRVSERDQSWLRSPQGHHRSDYDDAAVADHQGRIPPTNA
jgi:hypothetical protein